MCLAASLMGVVVFLRKQVLIGETLSHASYPGVILGVIIAGALSIQESEELTLSIFTLAGAFATAVLGLFLVLFMERRLKVASDAALCFVLSAFFGIGLALSSEVQFTYTTLYKQVISYLYGQAATMTDIHIFIYGLLSLIVLAIISVLYKELQVMTFDRQYAKSIGISVRSIDTLLFILVAISVIIGIRSVGVVLMSAMLIAPAVAARQFTNRLSVLFVLAALFGMASGFLGNYFSVQVTVYLSSHYPAARIILPTGPMIVIVASAICLLALLLAPERGLLVRLARIGFFRYECICENLLKALWRLDSDKAVSPRQLAEYQSISSIYLRFILWRMTVNGWLRKTPHNLYQLTQDGKYRAAKIVRLHRLWEVYLVNYLGAQTERVHRNAEEMEHIITPEIEQELTYLLQDPKKDPHHQPIPPREDVHAV